MSRILILLSALLIWSTSSAFAQEKKPTDVATIKVETDPERPKSEVDRLLDEARERGEPILGTCLQECEGKVIDENVEVSRPLELPKPAYPPIARAAHVSGQVVVRLIIDVDGTVMAAAVVSGHPLLFGVSLEAAKNSRFSPTKLEGKPVKVTGVIAYNFVSQ